MMIPHMRHLALILLLASPAVAQTPGTLNLSGPSTGGPVVTTATINAAVNAQLGAKADAVNPVFTGNLQLSGNATLSSATPFIEATNGSSLLSIKGDGSGGIRLNTIGTGAPINILGGTLTLNPPAVFTGGPSTKSAIFLNYSPTGTGVSGNISAPVNITSNSSGMAIPNVVGQGWAVANISDSVGGSTATAGRHALYVNEALTSPTGNLSGASYTAISAHMTVASSDNGTLGSEKSSFWAENPVIEALSGATNLAGIIGSEYDISVRAGASTKSKMGLNVGLLSEDAVQGTAWDIGIDIQMNNAAAASLGFNNLFAFGAPNARSPLASGGTILGAVPNTTGGNTGTTSFAGAHGVDFGVVNFSADAWKSPGARILGNGTHLIGTGSIAPTAAGFSIDAPNQAVTAVAIHSGLAGNSFQANDIVADGLGGLYQIPTVSSGVPTAITIVTPAYSSSPPSNPIAVSGGNGVSLSIDLTWTAESQLSIQPSGGVVKVGTGMMTANGAVATTMTGIGPTGSHTTVQEWMTVTNAAGTVRYIPAY